MPDAVKAVCAILGACGNVVPSGKLEPNGSAGSFPSAGKHSGKFCDGYAEQSYLNKVIQEPISKGMFPYIEGGTPD